MNRSVINEFDSAKAEFMTWQEPSLMKRRIEKGGRVASGATAVAAMTVASVASSESPVAAQEITVEAGDSLYRIAAKLNPEATHTQIVDSVEEIASQNGVQLVERDDGSLHAIIHVGDILQVPDAAATPVTRVVEEGDSLYLIASDSLDGDATEFEKTEEVMRLADQNNIKTTVEDGRLHAIITPGQELVLGSSDQVIESSSYVIQADDTLSEIAEVATQVNPTITSEEFIQDVLVNNPSITDPDVIRVGDELKVTVVDSGDVEQIQENLQSIDAKDSSEPLLEETPVEVLTNGPTHEWSYLPGLADVEFEDFLEPTPLILDLRFPDLESYPYEEMKGFVYHWTGGGLADGNEVQALVNGLSGNESCPNGCSVQFLITENGGIYQLTAQPNVVAMHAAGVNNLAAGVEIEGASEDDLLSNPAIFTAAVKLGYHMRSLGVPVTRDPGSATGFLGHYETDSLHGLKSGKQDPGPEFMRLVFAAIEELDQDQAISNLQPTTINGLEATSDDLKAEELTSNALVEADAVEKSSALNLLSGGYREILAKKPTIEFAEANYDSFNGQGFGPRLSIDDITILAYEAGFRGEDLTIAVSLCAGAESGGAPYVINSAAGEHSQLHPGTVAVGLCQILDPPDWDEPIRDREANLDPLTNLRAAFVIWGRQGWNGWEAYQLDAHLKFIVAANQSVAKLAVQGWE